MAKEEFTLRGIEFEYINLSEIGKTASEVTGRDNVKTVPQIYYNGQYVGGYQELMSFLDNGVTLDESDECRACEG
jgi:glutaredoxin